MKEWLLSNIDRKEPVFGHLKKQYSKQSTLLDFGCGNGLFLRNASKHFSCVGVDFSVEALKLAKVNAPSAAFIHGSLDIINQIKPKSFDVITCFDVLEHVLNPSAFLYAFQLLVKSAGVVVISVPNTDSFMHQWRGNQWWAYEDKTHITLKSRSEWKSVFKSNGFSIIHHWSSGFINHPLPGYRLPKRYLGLHYLTQTLGLLGVSMPSRLSDVDFFALSPRY